MPQPLIRELQAHLQAYLNTLELWKALKKQTDDPYVKGALDLLIDGGQESLALMSGHLRRMGIAPGAYELDRRGKARIREVLTLHALSDQLFAVRRSLADLVAWYGVRVAGDQADTAIHDLLASLSEQTHRMLTSWDRHMDEMRVPR